MTKSCELDPQPSSLVKRHVDALSPLPARVIMCLDIVSCASLSMKHTVVVSILKKGDRTHPITAQYMTSRFGIYQCAYRVHRSAETALVRIHNDIAQGIESPD